VRVFERWNLVTERQSGDHIVMIRPDLLRPVIVPKKRNIHESIIHSNLRTIGRTKKEFLKEYRSV